MKKRKFYVVWSGVVPGIYNSWEECQKHIKGIAGAKYKAFESEAEAKAAFANSSTAYIGTSAKKKAPISLTAQAMYGNPILDSIAVDGAWNTATGDIEYKGVYLKTGEEIFKKGPYADGTNNIAEFLALVHALAFCKNRNLVLPIYSDSRNAIGWIKQKKAKTNHQPSNKNKPLFELLERGEQWLKDNTYPNKILKWETKLWGENPADFGRK